MARKIIIALLGASTSETDYTLGTMCNNTCIRLLTYAIHDAYIRGVVNAGTYTKLINIGAYTIPALGNMKPTTFTWAGPANTGDPTSLALQAKSWNPYTDANPYYPEITSWGYIRLLALQGRHEANYNDTFKLTNEYRDFLGSWMTAYAFVEYSNEAILASDNSKTFLAGTYSNMNDLSSADVAGVSLALPAFGQDFITSGKAIDLKTISTFGIPSNLLMTLQRYNAVTNSVSLALLATGLASTEVSDILGNVNPVTHAQEQLLYSAFTIITGQDLADVCIPLNCKTAGLNSLADLLNPQKLFPNSYTSLTVPIYNAVPTPTNSKTYYPIYEGARVSARLMSMVGVDFGSYLHGIMPDDISVACGAFGATMQQIRNISSVPVEKFAQVVGHIETTKGLPLVNGTTVPVNLPMANGATSLISLGSGPQGTYTMSDFFGAMSGLPYNVTRIQNIMSMVRDVPGESAVPGGESLYDIYKELYLAVTWEQALGSVTIETQAVPVTVGYYVPPTYDPDPPYGELTPGYWVPSTYLRQYRVSGIYTTNQGGGYGRGRAPAPTASFNYNGSPSCGASASVPIGTDKNDVVSFGRGSLILLSGGSWTNYPNSTPVNAADGELGPPTMTPTPNVTIEIKAPPTALPTIPQAVPMVNTNYGTAGWPGMNTIIWENAAPRTYVNQANAEIAALRTKFPALSTELNTLWDDTGIQLTIEQRARSIAFPPVPTPRNNYLSLLPTVHYAFVDSIPRYGLNTSPHMYAQTLEAISNMSTVGGQSIVAMMRQSRNQDRLALAGITLDNNIPAAFTPEQQIATLANGTGSFLQQDLPITPASEAVATATVVAGEVTGIVVSSPGAGYTSAPEVVITSTDPAPGGSGATATANVSPLGVITTIDVVVNGVGYTVPPIVEIVPTGSGVGATATATIDSTGAVTGIVVDLPGSGYNTAPIINIIPEGSGATATAVIQAGAIVNVIIDTPGTGYVTPPLISFAGGIPTTLTSPQRYGVYVPSNGTYYITNPAFGGTTVIGTGPIGTVPNGTGAGGTVPNGTGAGGTVPNGTGLVGQPVDTGKAAEPGSLAGSPYTRLVPSNLNVLYTSDILLPATLTPAEAINEVTACNCDCWVSP